MRLSQDAGELRSDFERWIEGQLRAGAPLAGVADWASKLTGAAVRIAGILHLAKRVESESLPWNSLINADTMGQALRIARYAIPHACEAFGMMGADPVLVAARAVLDWIKRAELIKFTKRDAFCALRGSFRRAREVDAPLDELVERGYLRPRPVPAREGPGRLGSPIFDVNPLWDRGATQNPQISRNDPDAHDALDFADSANSATEVQ
ncbi:MAG: DUF3987 domain-containing protein [Deltaproteobacteria bacterium]|nr:DUF3987 domain-containing protein [Deltaproteobacteria bacterium]